MSIGVSDVLTFNASLSEHAPSSPVFLYALILHDVAPFCHCFAVAASLPVSSLLVIIFSRPHSTNVLLLHLSCSLDLILFGSAFFILLHQRQCTHLTFEVQCCEQHVHQQHRANALETSSPHWFPVYHHSCFTKLLFGVCASAFSS